MARRLHQSLSVHGLKSQGFQKIERILICMEFIENHRNELYEFSIKRKRSKWPWMIFVLVIAYLLKLEIHYASIAIPTIMILYYLQFTVLEESVSLMPDLGIQISQKRWFGTRTKFIPIQDIDNIMIIEGIRCFQVRFYLALLIKDHKNLLVLFPASLPRLHILERVFAYSNKIMLFNK